MKSSFKNQVVHLQFEFTKSWAGKVACPLLGLRLLFYWSGVAINRMKVTMKIYGNDVGSGFVI